MANKELNLGIYSINGYKIECYPATVSSFNYDINTNADLVSADNATFKVGIDRLFVLEGIELILSYTVVHNKKEVLMFDLENGLLTRLMGLVDNMCCESHRSECLELVNSELVVLGIKPMQFVDVQKITAYIKNYTFNNI